MKKFFVNGENANWDNLNVVALNNKSGKTETVTAIPEALRLKVTIADKFDTNAPDLSAVSNATSAYAMRHGKKRHFLLLSEGRVVGWAAFHRKETPRKVRVGVMVEFDTTVLAKSDREASEKALAEARNNLHLFEDAGYNASVVFAETFSE